MIHAANAPPPKRLPEGELRRPRYTGRPGCLTDFCGDAHLHLRRQRPVSVSTLTFVKVVSWYDNGMGLFLTKLRNDPASFPSNLSING